MDLISTASAALSLRTSQNQQAMTMALVKLAAAQQNLMADLLDQNVQNAAQTVSDSPSQGYAFSTYA